MNDKRRIRVSKFLSKHLRHDPEAIGLTLDAGGWTAVDALLDGCRRAGLTITHEDLIEVVRTNSKQRFAFDETGTRIRANQGHSVEIDLQLQPAEPPAVLFHGTADRFLTAILSDGLKKMDRHHVHLSADEATAVTVGTRHGRAVVLTVDAAGMARAGHLFYVSENGVWLTDQVPRPFLYLPEGPTA
ncbi:MAG TPA: RNA 2'-phosphotransferase [Gemmataceae bacterium]|jgi:putative RNA 2'-phosphotransferase|nr:RNA 2'-phosphotransferase [Gemmataceae bacterium]